MARNVVAMTARATTKAARAMVAGAMRTTAMMAAPLLLSSLDSRHRPVVPPQSSLLSHQPSPSSDEGATYYPIRSTATTDCHQQCSSTATHSLLTATVILRCTVVLFLLILHRLIGASWLLFHCCSSRWHHHCRSVDGGGTTV